MKTWKKEGREGGGREKFNFRSHETVTKYHFMSQTIQQEH